LLATWQARSGELFGPRGRLWMESFGLVEGWKFG